MPPSLDDPALNLADLMTHWPQTIPVFFKYRMLCVGCLVSRFHTVADACAAYALDVDEFLSELAATIADGTDYSVSDLT